MIPLVTPIRDFGIKATWERLRMRYGLPAKTIAGAMGISEAQLSADLAAGRLSTSRLLMAADDDDVQPFIQALWRALGAEYLELGEQELSAELAAVRQRLDQIQIRMLRAELRADMKREIA